MRSHEEAVEEVEEKCSSTLLRLASLSCACNSFISGIGEEPCPAVCVTQVGVSSAFHTPLSRTLGHSTFLHFQNFSAILSTFVFEEHEVSGGAVLASHLKILIRSLNCLLYVNS